MIILQNIVYSKRKTIDVSRFSEKIVYVCFCFCELMLKFDFDSIALSLVTPPINTYLTTQI